MAVFETIFVAFAMFSALPAPRVDWTEKNMRYALCAFPLVGLVVGAAWWGWAALSGLLGLGTVARAAGLCLLPVALTGGIHLDGYADTCDALASHASPARKQEILKDPRCGAFAVLRLCVYFLAYFAVCTEFATSVKALSCTAILFVFSRTLSGLAIAALPLAKNTGLAHTFAATSDRRRVRGLLLALTALLTALLVLVGGLSGAAAAAVGGLVFWRYAWVAKDQFGGISGDLAGWFLQRAELWMLAALVVCQKVEALV